MRRTRIIGVTLLILVGLALFDRPGSAYAVPLRERPWRDSATKRVNWSTTKVVFEVRRRPWREVLQGFADQAQMPLDSRLLAEKGDFSFTFINPKGRAYSLVQIFDMLNEVLMAGQRLVLVRDEDTLRVISCDGRLDTPVPRVRLEDLPKLGKTEFVEVVVTLNGSDDEQATAARAKRMLGDLGHATSLGNGQLLLRAPASSLRFALELHP